MLRDITLASVSHSVTLFRRATSSTLAYGGHEYPCALQNAGPGEYTFFVDGISHRIWIAVHKDIAYVHAFGRAWELEIADPLTRAQHSATDGDAVATAPMPGTATTIFVAQGDVVQKGQPLLVIESMKMQTEIIARRDGVIERVFLVEGQSFERGACLVSLVAKE